jgi:hypothetical protein
LLQLFGCDLIGDRVSRLDEHLVGDTLGLRCIYGETDSGEDAESVRLSRQERFAAEQNRRELHSRRIQRLAIRPLVGVLGQALYVIGRIGKGEVDGAIVDS